MMPRALTKRIVDQNGGVWGRVLIDLIAVAVQFRHKIRRRQDHRSPGFLSRLAARRHVTAVVEFRKGSLLKVDLWDRYWSALVARGVEYEAPIRFILSLFRREPVFFLDAGANIGYWSVLATGDEFSRWSAIAVEASPRTFEKLVENARLNGARFDCLNRALAEGSGIEVHLLTPEGKHAEARVIDEPAPRGGVDLVEAVTTISIDNLVEQTELQTSRPVILERCSANFVTCTAADLRGSRQR
jgi:FkbM family methyltransferase